MPSPGRVIRPAADEASEGSSSTYISSCESVKGDLSKLDGKRAGAAETLKMVIEKYSDAVKMSAFPKRKTMDVAGVLRYFERRLCFNTCDDVMLSGCGRTASAKLIRNGIAVNNAAPVRSFASTSVIAKTPRSPQGRVGDDKLRWNYNPNPFDPAPTDEAASRSFPLLTAKDLSKHTSPPRKIRLLARDFIDDSLYNPNYGYFPKQAVIFDPDAASQIESGTSTAIDRPGAHEGLDFSKFRSMSAWNEAIAETYGAIEGATDTTGAGRQVWHTPTELFKVRQIPAAKFQLSPRVAILCTSNCSTSSS